MDLEHAIQSLKDMQRFLKVFAKIEEVMVNVNALEDREGVLVESITKLNEKEKYLNSETEKANKELVDIQANIAPAIEAAKNEVQIAKEIEIQEWDRKIKLR